MDSDEEIPLDSEEESNSYNCSGDDVTAEAATATEEYYSHHSKKDYTVLKEEMIKQLQENDISEVSGVLSVSRGTACTLLLRQNWKVSSVFEDWFSDEERLHKSVGISSKEISPKPENYCKICMENVDIKTMLSAACGHLFYSDCWRSHVSISINDVPEIKWIEKEIVQEKEHALIKDLTAVGGAESRHGYKKEVDTLMARALHNRGKMIRTVELYDSSFF